MQSKIIKNLKYTNFLFFLILTLTSELFLINVSKLHAEENQENKFKKLSEPTKVNKEFKKGRLNPFQILNYQVNNASGLNENKINLLGIMSSVNTKIALIEYEGKTYKLCLGRGGKCNKDKHTIIPKEWEITLLDDKNICFEYKINDETNDRKSICQ